MQYPIQLLFWPHREKNRQFEQFTPNNMPFFTGICHISVVIRIGSKIAY
jgi:hypothetical protein